MPEKNALLRELPSVSALLDTDALREARAQFGQVIVSRTAKAFVADLRNRVQSGDVRESIPGPQEVAIGIAEHLRQADRITLQPVINATGILLHTGLGRSPLATEAIEATGAAASGYCNVELDLASGKRTQRSQTVDDLLCQLTGAEASHVVNNNAGATALVLAALATNREVIVSHGELIEIGGGYRLPEVIETFGARLRPVGTTNKTRLSDYENAIGEQSGAILVVHPSNYQISGFTQTPRIAEIAAVAIEREVPLVHDIGSGAMIDFARFGCQAEPVAADSVKAGADLVLFSGDKLLGGPQSGVILGRKHWIDKVVQHPLNRALRVDKVTLAALRATLQLYRRPDQAQQSIPLLRLLGSSVVELKARAEAIADRVRPLVSATQISTAKDEAYVGGGSVPQQAIESWCIVVRPTKCDVATLARALRMGQPAVVPRVQNDRVLLGLHGVFPDQDQALSQALTDSIRSSNNADKR